MNTFLKIVVAWISLILIGAACLTVFPNCHPSYFALALDAVMLLMGLVSLWIFLKEPSKSNKPIFLNFSVFFFLSLLSFGFKFVGFAFLTKDQWIPFYVFQYLQILHFFLLASAIVYLVIDCLFNNFAIHRKYVLSSLIVIGTFAYYYYPYFENPNYLRSTQDIVDWKAINGSKKRLAEVGNSNPSAKDIASITNLGIWRDGFQIGTLYEDRKVQRVSELLPYLEHQDNVYVLLYKPLYLNNINVNVMCIVFVFLFFGYQYKNDPPQGAYIEKITFLFLPYCSLEVLHHYAYIKSVEYGTFEEVKQIGLGLSLLNLILLLVFFSLRLRFITSVKGEFYERELVSDAEHISRWRDAFDNLVVRHFLNPKAIHGRLFASRTPRNKA